MPNTPAQRIMRQRLIPLTVIYLAGCLAAMLFINFAGPPDIVVYLISLLLSVPLVACIFVIWRYVTEEKDEYIRMMFVQNMVVSTGFTLAVTTIWGVLELYADAPALPIYYTLVIWCVGLALSHLYRRIFA
ncbi:hypothetical protein KCG44_03890 [Pacificimonas sp. WHA3]|uniref:Uncharacterized protein n=1 Tax=Pacificimonas pallii TaxID=2827236 RepID=A0ABS6SC64_9SPHN|nr:hypothetical protein [Pacificimonas pallii]MBV7255921.1 hypothetical protein [Pacificimonas pallii]